MGGQSLCPNMNNFNGYSLDDLVRDPNFNFITFNRSTDNDNDNHYDFTDPSQNDSPYTQSTFNTFYYDTSDFVAKFSNDSKFSLLSLNIQSLPSKYEQLKEMLNDLNHKNALPDIICLQEIWNVIDGNLFPLNDYQPLIFKCREKSQGGGVGIYLKKGIIFKILTDKSTFIEKLFESIFIEVTTQKGKKLVVGSIYRPNSSYSNLTSTEQFTQFNDLLLNLLSSLQPTQETFILGDFNIDLLKNDAQPNTYLDSLFISGFIQTVTRPTRCTNHCATLIDHCITNTVYQTYETAILTKRISDHFPIIVLTSNPKLCQNKATYNVRDMSDNNIKNFTDALNNLSWNDVLNVNDADTSYENFSNIFKDLHDFYFQEKKVKFNKNIHKKEPWMTKGLLISRLSKLKLEKAHATSPSTEKWDSFKLFRNIYNKTIKASKKLYYCKLLEANANNLRKTWAILNEVLKKGKIKHLYSLNIHSSPTQNKWLTFLTNSLLL
jgi:exonuclease III